MEPSQGMAFWRVHIERWRESGVTQAEYCRQNDLKPSRFYVWKSRVEQAEKKERRAAAREARNGFVELPGLFTTGASGTADALFELRLDRDMRLHVKINADLVRESR